MATTGIRFNVDASQAIGEFKTLDDTIGALTKDLAEAQQMGDQSRAAQITHQIDTARLLKPDRSKTPGDLFSGNTGAASYGGMNANKLDMRLELLTKTIDELTHQLEEATEKGQSREAYNISAALNNVEQEKQRLEHEKKLSEQKTDESGAMDAIKRYGLARFFTQGLGYAQQIAGIGFNRRTAMANGDYLGADVGVLEGASNIAQGIGGSLFGAGMTVGATPVGWGLMGVGGLLSILGTIGNIISGDKKADIAEGAAYERSLVHTGALNRRYAQGGTWEDNANRTSELLEKGTKYAEGTGMSAYGIVDIATQMSQYGAGSSDLALKQASDVAARVNATGVDAATVQNFLGTAYRYGDRGDVLGYASQARQAAGMTKAQDKEFLTALQSVIEEGIAGGYVKSVADVSKTMTMFARLSDNNPLWQGAQGASRLRQMDSAISGATGLQSTSDMIVATAASGILDGKNIAQRNKLIHGGATGTYVDTMLLMEQGNNPEMFTEIAKSVQDLEGKGNIAGQIERFKDIFKLNYHGSRDVYNMFQEFQDGKMTATTFQKKIESMKKDAAYQSDDTKRQNAITNIEASVALMAKSKFWEATDYLSKMSVDKEYDLMKAEMGTADFSFYDRLVTGKGGNEEINKAMSKTVIEYAMYGYKKGGLFGWGGHVADGEASDEELRSAANAMNNNKALKLAYEKGDKETFIALLRQLLTELFGTLNVTVTE
nr:hypothetical protein [uncultured Treponema sp.]